MKNLILSLILTLLKELNSSFKPGTKEKTSFKKEIKNDVKAKIEFQFAIIPVTASIKNEKILFLIENIKKSIFSCEFIIYYFFSESEVHRECVSNSGFT